MFLGGQPQFAGLWQSLLGLLASTEKLVPLGRLHMRSLQFHLRACWSQVDGDPEETIPLSARCRQDLLWWKDPANLLVTVPFRPRPPSKHLFTDASLTGWGAHCDDLTVSGSWPVHMQDLHINVLEMEAVFRALKHWQFHFRRQAVLLATDNSTVVAYINKQGGLIQSLWLSWP